MAALVPAAVPASRFKNIAVFCGVCTRRSAIATPLCAPPLTRRAAAQANPGARPEYAQAAEALAKEMARPTRRSAHTTVLTLRACQVRRRVGLVYGGGSVGIMGVVSRAVHSAGGNVLGVIPVGAHSAGGSAP